MKEESTFTLNGENLTLGKILTVFPFIICRRIFYTEHEGKYRIGT